MVEIAATANLTKGAVYHHFTDKTDLFASVLNECNERAQARVYEAIAKHRDDWWAATSAALEATLDVSGDPVAGRLIYLEGPIGLGWRRWRESERHFTHRNVRLVLESGVAAGAFPDDLPLEAMTHVMSGMVTHSCIAMAEASARQRKRVRRDLRLAMLRTLRGLTVGEPPA